MLAQADHVQEIGSAVRKIQTVGVCDHTRSRVSRNGS